MVWIEIKDYVSQYYTQILFVVIFLIVCYLLIKIIDRFMKLFFSKTELDRTVELLMQRTIKGFLWIIVFLVILSNLGVDVTAFIAGLGVVGFIIGFATKDVLSNVVAGLFLLINRPFKVGDEVEVAKVKGIVHEMNLAACVLHQGKDYVMVPNGKIWGAPIYNLTRLKSKKK